MADTIRLDAIKRACKIVVEWKPTLGGSQPLGILISDEIEAAVKQAFEEAATAARSVADEYDDARERFAGRRTTPDIARKYADMRDGALAAEQAIRARAKEAP